MEGEHMEEEQEHLARIYQLVAELERSDPSGQQRKVLDLVVERRLRPLRREWERRKREARAQRANAAQHLPQLPGPGSRPDSDE
jgi:hypothetical protein